MSRRCRSCGVLWAGDQRRKIIENVHAYGGDVAMITITAPGSNLLPWDRALCEHAPGERCSGPRGCQVERQRAQAWNMAAPPAWRALHRRASQHARRIAKQGGASWSMVARLWEYQARGVLHLHVVVPMGSAAERIASHAYLDYVLDHRELYGFGNVDRGRKTRAGARWRRALEVVSQGRAANYLAKYVAGSKSDGRLALTETVSHVDVPGHVVYVSRRLTSCTGVTMRTLRLTRQLHMAAIAEGVDLTAWPVIVSIGSRSSQLLRRGALLPRPPTTQLVAGSSPPPAAPPLITE